MWSSHGLSGIKISGTCSYNTTSPATRSNAARRASAALHGPQVLKASCIGGYDLMLRARRTRAASNWTVACFVIAKWWQLRTRQHASFLHLAVYTPAVDVACVPCFCAAAGQPGVVSLHRAHTPRALPLAARQRRQLLHRRCVQRLLSR